MGAGQTGALVSGAGARSSEGGDAFAVIAASLGGGVTAGVGEGSRGALSVFAAPGISSGGVETASA